MRAHEFTEGIVSNMRGLFGKQAEKELPRIEPTLAKPTSVTPTPDAAPFSKAEFAAYQKYITDLVASI
jgi:hypothetical protein